MYTGDLRLKESTSWHYKCIETYREDFADFAFKVRVTRAACGRHDAPVILHCMEATV